MQLTPTDVVVCRVGSLPKTSSGKIQRQKTRTQYLEKSVGTEGSRTLGANGDKLTLAKHVALSLVSRARHRARRVVTHAVEIRSVSDAMNKLKIAYRYFV